MNRLLLRRLFLFVLLNQLWTASGASQTSLILFPTKDEAKKVRLFFRPNKNISFTWSAPAAGLKLKIGTLSGVFTSQTIGVSGVGQNIRPDSIFLPIGRYFAIVTNSGSSTLSGIQEQAAKDQSIVFSNQVEFIVESQTPPAALSPVGTEQSTTPLFQWTSVPGVPAYMVLLSKTPFQITRDPATNELSVIGANLVWRYVTTNTSSLYGAVNVSSRYVTIQPAPLIPGNEYNYTILNVYDTENPAYASDIFGGVVSFKYSGKETILPPVLREPEDLGSFANLEKLTFRWDPVPNANIYTVYLFKRTISTSGAKQEIDIPFANVATSTTSLVDFPAQANLTNGKYAWYVSASDANGNGNASRAFTFSYAVDMGVVQFEALTTVNAANNNLVGYEVRAKAVNGGVTPGNAFVTVNERYIKDSLVTGTYQITGVKQGYYDTTLVVQITTSGTSSSPIRIALPMRPYPSTISGTVNDQAHTGVGSATVRLKNVLTGSQKNISTSTTGQFSVPTENGTYTIQASKGGYLNSLPVTLTATAGEQIVLSSPIVIQLDKAAASGTVVNDNGAPIPLATVTAIQGSTVLTTTTNTSGNYSFILTSGSWSISSSKEGFVPPAAKNISLTISQNLQVENIILLPNANTVNGTVFESITIESQSGTSPLDNVVVAATPSSGAVISAVTSPQGQYSISLKQGTYRIQAARANHTLLSSTQQYYDITVGVGQTISNINFTMAANPSSITGTVSLPDGSSVGGALIRIANVSSANSSANGTYVLSVPPGTFSITAACDGYSSPLPVTVSLSAGQKLNGINFQMTPNAGVISGYAMSGGERVADVLISAAAGGDSTYITTAADGTFSLSVHPGTWLLTAKKSGFLSTTSAFTVGPGQRSSGNTFTLTPNIASIRGLVSDGKSPLRNVQLQILDAQNNLNFFTTLSKDDGSFALTVPAQTGYKVSAIQKGYGSKYSVVPALNPLDVSSLTFELVADPSSAAGVIQNQSLNPASSAKILVVSADGSISGGADADQNGKYSIGMAAGKFMLRVSAAGYLADSLPVTTELGQSLTNINFRLTDNFSMITGMVSSGNVSLAGAIINISSMSGGATAASAGDGSFLIPKLIGGTYSLKCSKPGYRDASIAALVLPGGQSRSLSFSLSMLQGRISGSVKSASGEGIPSATVTAKSSSGQFNAVTVQNGTYSFAALALGQYFITAIKSGYSSIKIDSVLLTESSFSAVSTIEDFKINLMKITGTVKDSLTGAALAAATISVTGPAGSGTAASNTKGDFSMENFPQSATTYSVAFSKQGYTQFTQSVSAAAADTLISINAQLVPNSGKISGRVLEGSGAPPPFTVSVKAVSSSNTYSVMTDADGIFLIENAATGTTYVVGTDIFKKGYANASVTKDFPRTETMLAGISLPVEVKTGIVKGNAGTADATLELSESSGKIAPAILRSSTDVSYSFTDLPSGNFVLKPSKDGFSFDPPSSQFTLATNQSLTVSFTAAADTSSLLVKVVDPNSAPLSSAAVSCVSADTAIIRNATTTSSGEMYFTKLPAKGRTYIVRVSRAGYSPSVPQSSIALQTNAKSTLTCILVPNNSSFNGTVVRRGTSAPVSAAKIAARRISSGEQLSTTADAEGKFSFTQVPKDSFIVIASKEGFSPDTVKIFLDAGKSVTLNPLQLTSTTVNVAGTVRYEGSGVADVTVTASSVQSTAVQTDQDGRYAFIDLPLRPNDDTTVYQLRFEKSGIEARQSKLLIPRSASGSTITVAVVLVPSGKIKITVTDGIQVLSGVKILFSTPDGRQSESFTPSTGIFETAKTLGAGIYLAGFLKEPFLAPQDSSRRIVLSTDATIVDRVIELPFSLKPVGEIPAGENSAVSIRALKKYPGVKAVLYFKRETQSSLTAIGMSITDSVFTGSIPAQFSTEKIQYHTEVSIDSTRKYASMPIEVTPTARGIISSLDVDPNIGGASLRLGDSYSLRLITRDGASAPLGMLFKNTARGTIAWKSSDSSAISISHHDTSVVLSTLRAGSFMVTATAMLDNIAMSKSFAVVIKETILKSILIGGAPAGNEMGNRTGGIQLTVGGKDTSGKFINVGNSISWALFPLTAGTIDSTGFLTIDSTLIGKITVAANDRLSKLTQRLRLNITAKIDSSKSFFLTDKNGMECFIPKNSVTSPIDILLEDATFGPGKKYVFVRSSGKNFIASSNLYYFNYKGGALNGDSLQQPAVFRTVIDPSLKIFDGDKIIGLYDPSSVEWLSIPAYPSIVSFSKSQALSVSSSPALEISSLRRLKAQYTVLAENQPLGFKYISVLPNPFSPEIGPSKIGYLLTTTDQQAFVSITLYNIRGEHVRTLLEDDVQYPGRYGSRTSNKIIVWDGKTDSGENARNGRYIVRLRAKDSTGEKIEMITIVLVK